MLLAQSPIVGTIRVEPMLAGGAARPPCDDSTLGLLLESFAYHDLLDDEPGEILDPVRFVACTRLSRILAAAEAPVAVRANLAQLLDDLQAEYDQLGVPAL